MRKSKKVIALILAIVTMFSVLSFQASACGIRGLVHGVFIRPCICTELKMLFCPVIRGLLDFMPHGSPWWHHRDWYHDEEEEDTYNWSIVYQSGNSTMYKIDDIVANYLGGQSLTERGDYNVNDVIISGLSKKQAEDLKALLAQNGTTVVIRQDEDEDEDDEMIEKV